MINFAFIIFLFILRQSSSWNNSNQLTKVKKLKMPYAPGENHSGRFSDLIERVKRLFLPFFCPVASGGVRARESGPGFPDGGRALRGARGGGPIPPGVRSGAFFHRLRSWQKEEKNQNSCISFKPHSLIKCKPTTKVILPVQFRPMTFVRKTKV